MTRRDWLAAMGIAAAAPGVPSWAAKEEAKGRPRPWRKIHLDFHNSQHVKSIGEKFNADEFGDRLAEAHVNAIVVFAKDMHGYFYYPSQYGPVHPGLKFDLLGPQVEACRKRNIAVYAYYCTTWDNYLAEKHPEWLAAKRDRSTYLPKFDETPRWTALCLVHEPFVKLMLDHTREFVSKYELDGAWFDMPVPIAGECFCSGCLEALRGKGLDPMDTRVQREHKQALHVAFLSRAQKVVSAARPGCQVDFNGQCVYGLGERAAHQDNVDIEALPTGQWGYWYFPTAVRYTRTYDVVSYGMTGRFHSSWADFGGLKLPAQLDAELAAIVAQGARCDVGDQMPPDGRLDPAVYRVIGKSFSKIKEIEPYLEGAEPVAEAAILTGGLPLDKFTTEDTYGLVKLLTESRVQFDILEPHRQWERYKLIVLNESQPVDGRLANRLHAYLAKGGAVLAIHKSGLIAGADASWLTQYGFRYAGESPFSPAYLAPKEKIADELSDYQFALYEGASQWKVDTAGRAVALLGEPAFQRSPKHYTSHRQTPFDRLTEYAALGLSNRAKVGLIGFPIGASYYKHGYWLYRKAFDWMVDAVLPEPMVQSNAPLSTELTVTRQKGRQLVHIVNFASLRGSPKHPDFYEDPIPLTDVEVRVRMARRPARAKAVVSGKTLPITEAGAGVVSVTVPRVSIHEIVSLEEA